jgi:hypothetical protein
MAFELPRQAKEDEVDRFRIASHRTCQETARRHSMTTGRHIPPTQTLDPIATSSSQPLFAFPAVAAHVPVYLVQLYPQPSGETAVLHKCANPSCENAFLKLTQGKLFLVETDPAYAQGLSIVSKKSSPRRIEHYWLCDSCAPLMTLAFEHGRGIVAVPLNASPQKLPPESGFHSDLAGSADETSPHPYYRRA